VSQHAGGSFGAGDLGAQTTDVKAASDAVAAEVNPRQPADLSQSRSTGRIT